MKKLSVITLMVVFAVLFSMPALFAQDPDRGTISGSVTDQELTEPIVAMVKAFAVEGHHWPVAHAMTDEEGNYELEVPYGEFHVEAHAMDYFPEWWQEVSHRDDATAVVVDEETNADGINFTLVAVSTEAGSIAGMVTETGGDPIADAVVRLHRVGDWHFHRMAHTGEDGAYLFDDVPPGLYELECGKDGYLPMEYPDQVEVNGDDVTGIDFTLEPLVFGSIAGTVTDNDSGDPLEGAGVSLRRVDDWHFHRMAHTGEDGTYLFDEIPPGLYTLECGKHGYVPAEYPTQLEVNGDDFTGIDFALAPLVFGGIAGVVTDAGTAEPVEGAFVWAIGDGWPHRFGWARTNENGEYSMELLSGEYELHVWAAGYVQYSSDEPIVVADEVVTVNVEMVAVDFGTISGTVYDADSLAIADALVEIRMVPGHFRRHVRTDENGEYMFDQVYPGTYRVRAWAYGYAHHTYDGDVVVENGSDIADIDFYLGVYESPYNGMISGVVTDEGTDDPIADARIVAIGLEGGNPWHRVRHTHSAEDGSYTFTNLPEGDYRVLCMARDYNCEFYDNKFDWQEADLVTTDAENINFALGAAEFGPRVLSGRVIQGEIPVDGAVVLAMIGDEVVELAVSYPDGYYYLENLDPSEYTLRVISPAESEGFIEVTVVHDDVYDADVILSPTSIDNIVTLPVSTTLIQNYPNPFNATTSISFNLTDAAEIDLSVFDLLGRKVATLASASLPAGSHIYTWSGLDQNGQPVSSGVYLYVLKADDNTFTKRMMLLK
ncbi:MAG: T9SS type A sorting domain-containing protein [candidate division Zixibacteria bacterium]|nr:T9SS type A sorting domain-containing protein [candidate division Zixibacteria bacterium]